MESHTRRAIAYVAGRLINEESRSSIYDYSESKYTNFGGNVSWSSVSIFDYEQSCYISGSSTNLYHYGDGHYVTLNVEGGQFSGFDYRSGTYFSGRASGRSLYIYDYDTSRYYQYSF